MLAGLPCSTSGRHSEALRFCRLSHRPLLGEERPLLGGSSRHVVQHGLQCQQLGGLAGRRWRPRRLRLSCSAEESPGPGQATGSGGSSSSNAASSGGGSGPPPGSNCDSDDERSEQRPQPPKSGEGERIRIRHWAVRICTPRPSIWRTVHVCLPFQAGCGALCCFGERLLSPILAARVPPAARLTRAACVRAPLFSCAGRNGGWLGRLAGHLKLQNPLRLVLNLAALLLLLRFWPPAGQRHPLGVSEPVTVQVRSGAGQAGWHSAQCTAGRVHSRRGAAASG